MDDDEDLERLLKEELSQLRTAPPGFDARLDARLLEASNAHSATTRHRHFRLFRPWAVAAVVALTVLGGSYWNREHEHRLAGEKARRNVLVALRITATTLDGVQRKLARRNRGEIR